MTSSSGAWASESKEVRLSCRFAIRASRDTRSPSGLIKTYSAAQYRSAVATSALRSASSYSRMDSRSSASALLVAAELESCAVAAAGARRISVRNDSKQSRFRIMVASLKLLTLEARIGETGIGIRGMPPRVHCGLPTQALPFCHFGGGLQHRHLERRDRENPQLDTAGPVGR